jgi:hypothetical protein
MKRNRPENESGFFKSIMLAYMILGMHLLLVAAIFLLIIFLRGVVNYMLWIFIAGAAAILASAFYFFRKMHAQGKNLKETLQSPMFNGQPVELSLLGGLASIKIGHKKQESMLIDHTSLPLPQLEDPGTLQVRELTELAGLFEKNLLTLDEYNEAKQKLIDKGVPKIKSA